MKRAAIALTILLLLVLGLHTALPHEHPEALFGSPSDAAFHHDDRKLFLFLALSLLLVVFFKNTAPKNLYFLIPSFKHTNLFIPLDSITHLQLRI